MFYPIHKDISKIWDNIFANVDLMTPQDTYFSWCIHILKYFSLLKLIMINNNKSMKQNDNDDTNKNIL